MGVGGVIILGAILKKQCEEKRQEKNLSKPFVIIFSRFDNISVLYVNAFESDKERTTGGLVLEDGRTFQFVTKW